MKRSTRTLCARASALLMLAICGIASAAPSAEAVPVIIGDMAAGAGGVAEPPISDVRLVNHGAGIPVNGVLLILAGGGTGTPPIVEISDVATPGTTLGGSLAVFMSSSYWVWKPSTPFIEGTTYQARLSAPDIGIVGNTDTFEAVAAITIARPEIMTAPSASWRSETVNTVCCSSLFGGVLGQTSCFPSEQRSSVLLEPGLSTGENAVFMNQFLFRAGTDGVAAANSQLAPWPNIPLNPFYTQADEYCFTLEAVDLISGMVFPYDDANTCAPHGELGTLRTTNIEAGAAELDRLVCHAPPDQFKEEWCDLNEDPCADDAMATACGLYGYVCKGEPLPPDPFSGMAGFGGAGGTFAGVGGIGGAGAGAVGGEGGAGQGGAGGASGMSEEGGEGGDAASSSHGSSGCSATHARNDRGAALGMMLGAAALALSLRRPFRRTRSRATR